MASNRLTHTRSDFRNFVSIAKDLKHNNLTLAQIHTLSPFAYHVTAEKLKYWTTLGLVKENTNLAGTLTYNLTDIGMALLLAIEDKV